MLPILLQAWQKSASKSPTAKKVRGTLRVAVWLIVSGGVLLGLASRSAHADVKTGSLMFGRELTHLIDDDSITDTVHLKLNGQSIHLKQEIQPKTVHEIISEYEEFCKKNPSSFSEIWAKGPIPSQIAPGVATPPGLEAGILKEEGATEGMLICIAKGKKSEKGIMEAMSVFDRSGDLGAIGRLRYVYAKQTKSGSKVMAVWTDDSFNLNSIAVEGDQEAPGPDTQLPRPDGARRVINAEVVGTKYAVRVYEVKQSKADVAVFYDKWAKANDFRAIAPEADQSQEIRGYFRGGSQVMVGVFTNPDQKTYVSISELWPKNGHSAEKVTQ
jgi:hypothetical protein